MDFECTPNFYNDLDLTLKFILAECAEASQQRQHELHRLYFATFGEKFPEIRTVIFRQQNLVAGHIYFHTDQRSQKVKELENNSNASLLGYNHQKKYQLRFRGSVRLHHQDALAKSSWEQVGVFSRSCYLTQQAPGSLSLSPIGGSQGNGESSDSARSESQDGFSQFVVCDFNVVEMEWLYLHAAGHRRSRFSLNRDLTWTGQWLQP